MYCCNNMRDVFCSKTQWRPTKAINPLWWWKTVIHGLKRGCKLDCVSIFKRTRQTQACCLKVSHKVYNEYTYWGQHSEVKFVWGINFHNIPAFIFSRAYEKHVPGLFFFQMLTTKCQFQLWIRAKNGQPHESPPPFPTHHYGSPH